MICRSMDSKSFVASFEGNESGTDDLGLYTNSFGFTTKAKYPSLLYYTPQDEKRHKALQVKKQQYSSSVLSMWDRV